LLFGRENLKKLQNGSHQEEDANVEGRQGRRP
jgi:hypothetical protein